MSLKTLGIEAWESADRNGWHEPREDENGDVRQTSTFERLALIHSEVSEALEVFRKHGRLGWYGSGDKPEGLASELADIIIRTAELSEFFGYDLDAEVEEKMLYNARRNDVPVRDGGKSI